MKNGFLLYFLFFLQLSNYAQNNSYYSESYNEIARMLQDSQAISLRRAVFLAEWAFLDGNLDYEEDFCKPISRGVSFMEKFIRANNLERYKTAKQIALCDYFFKPWSGNDYLPYEYDFSNDYPEDDWHYQLVNRVLKTHKGRCHSLPWAFKLFAEALDADAYIAYAPRHCFIMYKDEDNRFPEDWVNVETTSHQFHPTFWIKESFEIKDSAIIVGTYLTPLSDKETLAFLLSDLALGYYHKFGVFDLFTYNCSNLSLSYYKMNPNAIMIKAKSLIALIHKYTSTNDIKVSSAYINTLVRRIDECSTQLDATYWTEETEEMRKRFSISESILKDINLNH